jgi:hypothetical protein
MGRLRPSVEPRPPPERSPDGLLFISSGLADAWARIERRAAELRVGPVNATPLVGRQSWQGGMAPRAHRVSLAEEMQTENEEEE